MPFRLPFGFSKVQTNKTVKCKFFAMLLYSCIPVPVILLIAINFIATIEKNLRNLRDINNYSIHFLISKEFSLCQYAYLANGK